MKLWLGLIIWAVGEVLTNLGRRWSGMQRVVEETEHFDLDSTTSQDVV